MAPVLVLAVVAAGYFVESSSVRHQLLAQVQDALGSDARDLIGALIDNTYKPGSSTIATILSLAITFFSASGLFIQLNAALSSIWGMPTNKKLSVFRSLLLSRIFAFLAVLVFGLITLGWLGIDAWLQWLRTKAEFAGWPAISAVLSTVFLTVVFAASYRYFPRAPIKGRDVWLGAILAALGVAVAKYLLSLYFSMAHIAGAFGPAGALVLILLWIYYTSQIYFLGAEVVYSYSRLFGSRVDDGLEKPATYS
jgi:membrane protein